MNLASVSRCGGLVRREVNHDTQLFRVGEVYRSVRGDEGREGREARTNRAATYKLLRGLW